MPFMLKTEHHKSSVIHFVFTTIKKTLPRNGTRQCLLITPTPSDPRLTQNCHTQGMVKRTYEAIHFIPKSLASRPNALRLLPPCSISPFRILDSCMDISHMCGVEPWRCDFLVFVIYDYVIKSFQLYLPINLMDPQEGSMDGMDEDLELSLALALSLAEVKPQRPNKLNIYLFDLRLFPFRYSLEKHLMT